MIKAKATMPDGRAISVMGISAANVQRLIDGQPIYFDPATLKIEPGTAIGGITLFYAATDVELARALAAFTGPSTIIYTVPRGDERPQ